MYPNNEGIEFNKDYYYSKHLPLVKEIYHPFGLQQIEIDEALVTSGKHKALYYVIAYLTFNTQEDFMKASQSEGNNKVLEDIGQYTNVMPVVQMSQPRTF